MRWNKILLLCFKLLDLSSSSTSRVNSTCITNGKQDSELQTVASYISSVRLLCLMQKLGGRHIFLNWYLHMPGSLDTAFLLQRRLPSAFFIRLAERSPELPHSKEAKRFQPGSLLPAQPHTLHKRRKTKGYLDRKHSGIPNNEGLHLKGFAQSSCLVDCTHSSSLISIDVLAQLFSRKWKATDMKFAAST